MGRWREKEALSCSSIFQGYININTIQFETRAGGILNLNSSNIQIRVLCVHFVWESVSKNGFNVTPLKFFFVIN